MPEKIDLSNFACVDCKICTVTNREYYMVRHDLWKQHGAGKGMLCIGCLETRLGRELKWIDFSKAPLNGMIVEGFADASERLRNRLDGYDLSVVLEIDRMLNLTHVASDYGGPEPAPK